MDFSAGIKAIYLLGVCLFVLFFGLGILVGWFIWA